MSVVLNDLYDYVPLKIYQDNNKFKFSLDSILLAEFVPINNKVNKILDLCTGNASVPLILSTKTKASIDAFEIQDDIYKLAIESIKYNHLDNQIKVYNDNVLNIGSYKECKNYDIITCNPPFFKNDNNKFINEDEGLAIARHEIKICLEDVFKIASNYLSNKGRLYVVQRATRLDEIIVLANLYNINVKKVQLIKTLEQNDPPIVLVECIKNSKFGLKIKNQICIKDLKTYKNIFKEEL